MEDIKILDKLIVGRVEPHIYAFTTNTFPNYLKVGDTYRPVNLRLKEWKEIYPDLEKKYETKAMVDENTYFRDYSIHQYFETEKNKERINPQDYNDEIYVSNEFFKDTYVIDVEEAIDDIKNSFENNLMKYKYYDANTSLRTIEEYASTGYWNLRPNQAEVVENFKNAIKDGRNNLLMYAVMRFGKSFTAMSCALEMKAKIVVIVSAKVDVQEEWKKTIESADNFSDYKFITGYELNDPNIIEKTISDGKNIAIFLTLQDLQGPNIKARHKKMFSEKIDLLLIDETHFGARAEKYGQVLRNYPKDVIEKREDSFIDIEEAQEQLKVLNSKVKIHLSGTPYRILMGSEFKKEDIIAFCQFTDIVNAQKEWDEYFLNKEDVNEWDNPYYGFPQMIRFAFNPSKKIREKMEELTKYGISFAFSELLRPLSINKTNDNQHKKFKYEDEVLELFEVIDGSKQDDEILGFLDYDKIKSGKMCRHIVIVLPFCASCDALEEMIKNNLSKFKNLSEYEIINISGVDDSNSYKKVVDIKNKIKQCEKDNIKTITLTVNRMLTGSTVEEWDTMIYLKDTSSPQEYDQAIFRLQNQYVKNYLSEDGDEIKLNKKPQTILVDFAPNRMFIMQEKKSLIYNVNVEKSGNSKLQERLENELKISPIITVNKNKIHQINAVDIMREVSNYSNSRGVIEEANDIPVDFNLMSIDEIKNIILSQPEIGTKDGLKIFNSDDEDDNQFEELTLEINDEQLDNNINNQNNDIHSSTNSERETIAKKFKTYYIRLLFYSFLTNDMVNSLDDILKNVSSENNKRIIKNLGLNPRILKLISDNIDPFIVSQLDYKIQHINTLSNDKTLSKIDRALVAVNKFEKISESEIITPQAMCESMVNVIPIEDLVNDIKNGKKIIDIASKQAEFSLAFYKKLKNIVDDNILKDALYSIPTSSIAYEFTRKIYELLDLNVSNIANNFNSYKLLNVIKNNQVDYVTICDYLNQDKEFKDIELENNLLYKEGNGNMKFSVVVGNPPYQEGRKSIFQHFQLISDKLKPNCSVLIYPGKRWIHKSGKGMENFGRDLINDENLAKLIYYPNSRDIFDCVDVTDGISIVYKNYNKKFDKLNYTYINGNKDNISTEYERPGDKLIALCPLDENIVNKIVSFKETENLDFISNSVSEQKFFGVESNFVELNSSKVKLYTDNYKLKEHEIKLLTNDKAGSQGRSKWFVVNENLIEKNKEAIHKWKVVVSSAHPGGQDGRDNQLEVLDNKSVFGRARVSLKLFDTEKEAINFYNFFNSKIIKFSLLLTDENLGSFGMQTLDIVNYSDDNKYIDFSKNIDEQLCSLLKLTEEEMKYISDKLD